MKPRTFITLFQAECQISQNGLLTSLVLWLVLALLAGWLLPLSAEMALAGGLLATLIHWFNTFCHHLGHAAVAQRVGYPMQRIRMVYLLCGERYPKDEPALPAAIHIQRALGGPVASLVFTLVGLVIVWALRPSGGLAYYLALFFTLENFLVYFLGSLLPLGFTDGSTLLYWLPRRNATT